MTMTSIVKLNGEVVTDGKLAAFVGGNLQGLTAPMDGPPFGPYAHKPQFALMTYGNAGADGQAITYNLCVGGKIYTDVTVSDTDAESFGTDKTLGSAVAPVMLEFTSGGAPDCGWSIHPPAWENVRAHCSKAPSITYPHSHIHIHISSHARLILSSFSRLLSSV